MGTKYTVSNDGKVAITNDLTVDTNVLKVDTFNNRVGIGTAAPLSLMDIAGGIAIGSYAGAITAPANGLIISGDVGLGTSTVVNKLDVNGGVAIGSYAGANVAPSNSLIVSGKLGIGKANPTYNLEASTSNAGSSNRFLFENTDNTNTGSDSWLQINTGGASSGDPILSLHNGVVGWYFNLDNSDSDKLKIGDGVSSSMLVITSAGNIGLGTASPSAIFHAYKTGVGIQNLALFENSQAAAADVGSRIAVLGAGIDQGNISYAWNGAATTDAYLALYTRGSDSITEKMRISSDGKVGIGTISASSLLDIRGASYRDGLRLTKASFANPVTSEVSAETYLSMGQFGATGGLLLNSYGDSTTAYPMFFAARSTDGGTTNTHMGFQVAKTDGGTGAAAITASSIAYQYLNYTTQLMTILGSGKVGLGTATPLDILHLDGYEINLKMRSASTSGPVSAGVVIERSRGTQASPLAVQTDDLISSLASRGYDGSAFTTQAAVRASASENYSGSNKGTYLHFHTTPIGSTVLTERIRILDNGNVGIGTATPAQKFVVNGNAIIGWTTNLGYNFVVHEGTNQNLGFSPNPNTAIFSINDLGNTFQPLNIDGLPLLLNNVSGGNVGVGTQIPGTINGQTTLTGIFLNTKNASGFARVVSEGTSGGALDLISTSAAADVKHFAIMSSGGRLGFYSVTDAVVGTEHAVLLPGGNFGIGTAAPGQKLTVAGIIESTIGGVKFPDGSIQTIAAGASTWAITGSHIYNSNAGNVGINTTTPTAKLDVNGSIRAQGGYTATSGAGINFTYVSGVGYISSFDQDTLLYKALELRGSSVSFVTAGNVGINTTTPTAKLDILQSANSAWSLQVACSGATGLNYGFKLAAGSNSSDIAMQVKDGSGASTFFQIDGDGKINIGGSNLGAKLGIKSTGGNCIRVERSSDVSPILSIFESGGMGVLEMADNAGNTDINLHPGSASWYNGSGSFGFGTNAPSASAVLEAASTTKGFLPPRMTTTQRDAIASPATGLVVFNTTSNGLDVFVA